jgi:hypothetical protein
MASRAASFELSMIAQKLMCGGGWSNLTEG